MGKSIIEHPNWNQRIANPQVVPYTYYVEIRIDDATLEKYRLPDNNILRGKTLIGLFLRQPDAAGSQEKTAPSGRLLIDDEAIKNCFLTLEADSVRVIDNCPLEFFILADGGERKYKEIHLKGFDPSNSYVMFQRDPGTVSPRVSDGESVELVFVYVD